jgi:hypothetical protein
MKFPKNPQIGQLFKPSTASSHKYKWVGYAWEILKSNSSEENSGYSKKIIHDVFKEVPVGQIDGVNLIFYLDSSPITGSEKVYLNGLLQKNGGDYTINENIITFEDSPTDTSQIVCSYSTISKIEVLNETPVGSIDNINYVYTLKYFPDTGTDHIYLNGLLQKNGEDYTIIDNFLSFIEAPRVLSIITCNYISTI